MYSHPHLENAEGATGDALRAALAGTGTREGSKRLTSSDATAPQIKKQRVDESDPKVKTEQLPNPSAAELVTKQAVEMQECATKEHENDEMEHTTLPERLKKYVQMIFDENM